MDGWVAPCCFNFQILEKYPFYSIEEIWNGEVFQQYRNAFKKNTFPGGCQICQSNYKSDIRNKFYASFDPRKTKPQYFEFALSNTCNLACKMCSGIYSSAFRKNVEQKPPIHNPYSSSFIEELKGFIPHLKESTFVGGEPFLEQMNFDIWEQMLDLNKNIKIDVITNASFISSKAKHIIEHGNFSFNISMDALSENKLKSIRKNIDYNVFIDNIHYLNEYCLKNNKTINISVCPLSDNWEEIPSIISFASENKMTVNLVSVIGSKHNLKWASSTTFNEILLNYTKIKIQNKTPIEQYNYNVFEEFKTNIKHWLYVAQKQEQTTAMYSKNNIETLKKQFINKCHNVFQKTEYFNDSENNWPLFENNLNQLLNNLPEDLNSDMLYQKLMCVDSGGIIHSVINDSRERNIDFIKDVMIYDERGF